MKVGLVGTHYPRPEHRDEFISRVHQVAEVLAATPGCLEVDCWLSEDNPADVTRRSRSRPGDVHHPGSAKTPEEEQLC